MTSPAPLRLGIIGIGVGAAEILPAMEQMAEIEVVAGADPVALTRTRFLARFPAARAYEHAEELCADETVEAVWVSSPNRFHAGHAMLAMSHGKHVVVEKPMALSLAEAEAMLASQAEHGVTLLAGHTMSYSAPVRAMRRIITSGQLGKLCAIHLLAYTDWMLRPRSADELDSAQGGGVPYRQAPHQVDTVRVLGGGLLASVRAVTGQWMRERPIAGYYSALMEFEDGTPATITHNGYGYFLTNELVPWGSSTHRYSVEERVAVRAALREGRRDESAEKQDMRIGGSAMPGVEQRGAPRPWLPADLGLLVASCERGDLRHAAHGLFVYDDEGVHEVDLGTAGGGQRRAELEELHDALRHGRAVFHDGAWGLATLEVCLGIIESGREHRDVTLSRQVAVPPEYDQELAIPYLRASETPR